MLLDQTSPLSHLCLLQLADTALPIGSLAHSFGLETLAANEILTVLDLPRFLHGYLEEAGLVEAVFCREAHRLAKAFSPDRWLELNQLLSARKTARETCSGSAALGRNFLEAVIAVDNSSPLRDAFAAAQNPPALIHHSTAFGLAAATIGIDEDRAVLAYLHQSIANLVSACQRLLPLGQRRAACILWNLKPALIEIAAGSATSSIDDACSFMPLLDWAAMEHPALSTRLFVS